MINFLPLPHMQSPCFRGINLEDWHKIYIFRGNTGQCILDTPKCIFFFLNLIQYLYNISLNLIQYLYNISLSLIHYLEVITLNLLSSIQYYNINEIITLDLLSSILSLRPPSSKLPNPHLLASETRNLLLPVVDQEIANWASLPP